MRKLCKHINDESGAELPEWIAMVAVILILLIVLAQTFTSNGNNMATEVMAAAQQWVERWSAIGAGGTNQPGQAGGPTNSNGSNTTVKNPAVSNPSGGNNTAQQGNGFFHQVGGFFHGLVVDGAIGTVTSVLTLGRDVLVMLPGTGHIADWIAPGIRDETLDRYSQMWEVITSDPGSALYAMIEPMVTAWENGEYGQAIGMGVFEGVMFFIPGDEVGKIAKLDKVLPDELLTAVRRIENATPDELAALLARADKLTPEELEALLRRLDEIAPEDAAKLRDKLRQLQADDAAKVAESWPCLVGGTAMRKPPGLAKLLPVPMMAPCVKINIEHLFHGEINKAGKPVGFHHRASIGHEGHARIVPGTTTTPNAQGVFQARVEIFDTATGAWKAKNSTFFPDAWNRQQVLDEVRGAFSSHTIPNSSKPNYWEGISPSGVRIGGYLDNAGNINTAFPIP